MSSSSLLDLLRPLLVVGAVIEWFSQLEIVFDLPANSKYAAKACCSFAACTNKVASLSQECKKQMTLEIMSNWSYQAKAHLHHA